MTSETKIDLESIGKVLLDMDVTERKIKGTLYSEKETEIYKEEFVAESDVLGSVFVESKGNEIYFESEIKEKLLANQFVNILVYILYTGIIY